jgi:hypothetical protein
MRNKKLVDLTNDDIKEMCENQFSVTKIDQSYLKEIERLIETL